MFSSLHQRYHHTSTTTVSRTKLSSFLRPRGRTRCAFRPELNSSTKVELISPILPTPLLPPERFHSLHSLLRCSLEQHLPDHMSPLPWQNSLSFKSPATKPSFSPPLFSLSLPNHQHRSRAHHSQHSPSQAGYEHTSNDPHS